MLINLEHFLSAGLKHSGLLHVWKFSQFSFSSAILSWMASFLSASFCFSSLIISTVPVIFSSTLNYFETSPQSLYRITNSSQNVKWCFPVCLRIILSVVVKRSALTSPTNPSASRIWCHKIRNPSQVSVSICVPSHRPSGQLYKWNKRQEWGWRCQQALAFSLQLPSCVFLNLCVEENRDELWDSYLYSLELLIIIKYPTSFSWIVLHYCIVFHLVLTVEQMHTRQQQLSLENCIVLSF